ncbi:HEAT repeat domain-containing protein [Archangium primigenium]|uniref:HEAT repeat domain-containing protein n=1 Tax=[Archangium] primigenium TaxID=2792470 RepID=UPI00195E851E|nr:HEAT repeat domain-containing protein [Archangium primigenium]
MKLLAQARLLFQEGKSDKVYEVDLLEVSPGQCVVNFRYGRRGTSLKEGSKTTAPVSESEARKVYDKLVQSKVTSGYLPEGAPGSTSEPRPPAAAPPPRPPPAPGEDPRERVLLEQLQRAASAPAASTASRWFRRSSTRAPKTRSLERIVWSLGELRVRAAEPLLLPLLERATPLRAYCIVAALGRLGSEASVSTLGRLYADPSTPDMVRRMATEALLQLSDEATRAEFRRDEQQKLPAALRLRLEKQDAPGFAEALEAHLSSGADDAPEVLEALYRVDAELARPAFLKALRTLPFRVRTVRTLRHLFKMAEYRKDGEVFGLIAWRYEKERSLGSQHVRAFSRETRLYLRRRVWRTLRELGEAQSPDYVRMAVGVLLAFQDSDAHAPSVSGWGRHQRHWDAWWPYWAFNQVLHRESPRYEPVENSLMFRCRASWTPGSPVPSVREEAFPRLWERTPQGLLHLLDESRCAPVHTFATRALRACPDFLAELDVDALSMLLGRPYETTARLGFELASKRLDARREPRALLLAVARAAYAPARQQAFQWMDEVRHTLLEDTGFLAGLATAPFADTRAYAFQLVRASVLPAATAQTLVGRLVAALLALPSGEDPALAVDVGRVVLAVLDASPRPVGLEVVRDLLGHPLTQVQEVGGELLLRRDPRGEPLPEELLLRLVQAEHAPLRAMGMRLLARLAESESTLLAQESLLSHLATSRVADVRAAVRPLLARLGAVSPAAGARLVESLLAALLRRRLPEGVPGHVVSLLSEELASALAGLPAETTWRLLESEDGDAQALGGVLLERRGAELTVDVARVVRLSGHEVRAVRAWGWRWLEAHVPEVRAELSTAVGLLDARWTDAREFGFRYFRERFAPEDFTLEVLVSVADSVRKDVQAFGRELLTRSFREDEGPELLLRLSEHPMPEVQLFATNYLDRFALGHPERVARLAPFFIRVLGQVNKGRVARQRVLGFLKREGAGSEASGRVALEVLHRLSATIAVEHRAAALEAMLAIVKAQPSLSVPFSIRPVEVRRAI